MPGATMSTTVAPVVAAVVAGGAVEAPPEFELDDPLCEAGLQPASATINEQAMKYRKDIRRRFVALR
jgi:hypothetical protein